MLTSHPTLVCLTLFSLAMVCLPQTAAEETGIAVRVRSHGAKFIGSSMGGVRVLIKNADTGELLAKGITKGSTGDTKKLMKTKTGVNDSLATPDAAVFNGSINIDEPTQVRIEASGPLAQRQSSQQVSHTRWVMPGKHLTGGDGVLLTLPGFVVDILEPPAHVKLTEIPQQIVIRANVTLMCGCPVEPGGLWDAEQYEIKVILKRDGERIAEHALAYAGQPSQFRHQLQIKEPGVYEAIVYAHDPKLGNTGLDRTTFIIASP